MRTAIRLSRLSASKIKVKSFSKVVIANNCGRNKVVCRFKIWKFFYSYNHFISPPGSEQADRWIGLSDRDSLQVASKGQLGNLSLEILTYNINLKALLSLFFARHLPGQTPPLSPSPTGALACQGLVIDNFRQFAQCVCWQGGMNNFRFHKNMCHQHSTISMMIMTTISKMIITTISMMIITTISKHSGDGAACVFMDSTDGSWKHSSCGDEKAAVCRWTSSLSGRALH